MTRKADAVLWIVQRASAVVLALCVVVHLVTIVHAMQGGLSGPEILARTRGNAAWLAFYCVFVVAVSVHAPIGLRAVLREWAGWRGPSRDVLLGIFALFLLVIGLRAAWAVFG